MLLANWELKNRRALCLIKMERADKAPRELEKVLAAAGQEGNVKALYLMGKAKRMTREFFTLHTRYGL